MMNLALRPQVSVDGDYKLDLDKLASDR